MNYILPGMLAAYTSQWKRLGPVFGSESNFGFGADDRCTAEALPGALRGICFKRIFRKKCCNACYYGKFLFKFRYKRSSNSSE